MPLQQLATLKNMIINIDQKNLFAVTSQFMMKKKQKKISTTYKLNTQTYKK